MLGRWVGLPRRSLVRSLRTAAGTGTGRGVPISVPAGRRVARNRSSWTVAAFWRRCLSGCCNCGLHKRSPGGYRRIPDDLEMRVSHETIYQSLFVQGRGELRRELVRCLRSGRTARRTHSRVELRGHLPGMVMVCERPAEASDRAVPGHWEGDLILGAGSRAPSGRSSSGPPGSYCSCTWEATGPRSTSNG